MTSGRIIGLTGGIGVGKSTVARLLADRGAHIIDVDLVCRQVIEPGGPAHQAVVGRFGQQLVTTAGVLDRAALAAVVFSDPTALADLTAISHPAANRVMAEMLAGLARDAITVLDVAVLVEYPELGRWGVGPRGGYQEVVVVEAPLGVRLERLATQRGMSRHDALARVRAQVDEEARRAVADHLLDNGNDLASLTVQVDRLWAGWRS
jgi:dephospho-CoA kinase